MKKLIIILLIFVSCKQNYQGYKIQNNTKSTMYINLSDGNYSIDPSYHIDLVTDDIITENNISFEDIELKPIIKNLNTNPDISLNIFAYRYSFEVHVFGNSDSVKISINGRQYNQKLPFYYGDNSTLKYKIISEPTPQGHTYTYVLFNGEKYQSIEHIRGKVGILSN